MPAPLKMVSHNVLLTEAEGGETAFARAEGMGIDIVRYDFRYHRLTTPDGWQWETTSANRWNDLLEPSLRWTRAHGMRTLVNLLTYKVPPHSREAMNATWHEHTGRGPLDERDCALWASWASGHGVDPGGPSPRDFAEALVDRLAFGQASGEYDIAGFCVLNEPNTRWPGEDNWRSIPVEGGYTTADHCLDLLGWVKGRIASEHEVTLGHAVTVVNPYSYRRHWRDPAWMRVARSPHLDVLGIDIYWDQFFGVFAWRRPEAMARLSEELGKPWWLVETAGASGRGRLWKDPSCRRVRKVSGRCRANGAQVLGYYRLWGEPGGGLFDYSGAYNIFTNPGPDPVASTDGSGERYWETLRDI